MSRYVAHRPHPGPGNHTCARGRVAGARLRHRPALRAHARRHGRRGVPGRRNRRGAGQQLVRGPVRELEQAPVQRARRILAPPAHRGDPLRALARRRGRGRRPHPFRQLHDLPLQHGRRDARVGPAAPGGLDHRARGAGPERPGQAPDGARREPAPGPGLLHAHQLDGAGRHPRRRGARLGRSGLRHQSDVVRHTGRQARRGHDLHREHPGSSPAARQLAQRPQQEPDQEHEQGLAGPPAVARVGDLGVLRLAPVGRGGAVVGRRRRLLAARPGLSGGSGRPEPRPQGLLHHLAVRRPLAG